MSVDCARVRWWAGLFVVLSLLGSGCEAPRSEDAHRARHAALEVRHEAVAVARRMAERADARCGNLSLQARVARWGAFTTTLEARLVRVVPGGVASSPEVPVLVQLVRLRRTEAGELAFVEILDHALDGLAGQRTRELRHVDGLWQVREDGQPFVELAAYDGMVVLAEAIEAYDRLLAGLGPLRGDARSAEGLRLARGDEASLACPLRAGGRRLWLDALGSDWEVLDAQARVEHGAGGLPVRRALTLELALAAEPEQGVRLELVETSRPGESEPVARAEPVMGPTVERDFFEVRALVRDRWRRALVPPVLAP